MPHHLDLFCAVPRINDTLSVPQETSIVSRYIVVLNEQRTETQAKGRQPSCEGLAQGRAKNSSIQRVGSAGVSGTTAR